MAKPTTKQKLSLELAPTFPASVMIPVPGGDAGEVIFTFKSRTRDEFKEFLAILNPPKKDDGEPESTDAAEKGPRDADLIMDIASGWDLADAFDAKSVEKLTQRYMGAAQAIFNVYMAELTGARAKN